MKRTQKLLHIGLGNENQTFLNIQADSARTGSSLKKKGLKFSKLCDPYLIDQQRINRQKTCIADLLTMI